MRILLMSFKKSCCHSTLYIYSRTVNISVIIVMMHTTLHSTPGPEAKRHQVFYTIHCYNYVASLHYIYIYICLYVYIYALALLLDKHTVSKNGNINE